MIDVIILLLHCCVCVSSRGNLFVWQRGQRSGTTTEQSLALGRIQHLAQGYFSPAAQMLDRPSKVPTTRLLCTMSQLWLFQREVTYSLFTLTVSHSQLESTEAVIRTDPSSSNFKKKVVKTCQFPAACSLVVQQCSHTDSLPDASVMFTDASLRAHGNVTTVYSDVLFTKGKMLHAVLSFWFQGLLLFTSSGPEDPVWQTFLTLNTDDCQWPCRHLFEGVDGKKNNHTKTLRVKGFEYTCLVECISAMDFSS